MQMCQHRRHAAARRTVAGADGELVGGERIGDRGRKVVAAVEQHGVLHPQRAEVEVREPLAVAGRVQRSSHAQRDAPSPLDLSVEEVAEGERARDRIALDRAAGHARPQLSNQEESKAPAVSYSFLFMRANGEQLREIGALIDARTLHPVVDRVFPFEATREALAYVEQGRAKGKVVIAVR